MRFTRDTERMVMSDIIYAADEPAGWAFIPEPTDKERRFCLDGQGVKSARFELELEQRQDAFLPLHQVLSLEGVADNGDGEAAILTADIDIGVRQGRLDTGFDV
jgi:hypothetical protein